ncbi:hypothetical protein ACFYZ2_15470 [Streptomyces sviceus]|uniref:hypothetical protein n=1 Tax=Streptomyces sviceus TaxID=285530 RepID=UPI0036A473A5
MRQRRGRHQESDQQGPDRPRNRGQRWTVEEQQQAHAGEFGDTPGAESTAFSVAAAPPRV